MYYGAFTLAIEDRTREGRQRKMNLLFQFLTEHAEEFGFEGFWETEQHWNGGVADLLEDIT